MYAVAKQILHTRTQICVHHPVLQNQIKYPTTIPGPYLSNVLQITIHKGIDIICMLSTSEIATLCCHRHRIRVTEYEFEFINKSLTIS